MVKSLGAGHVIDYTVEDFAQNGETYNVIFDTVGKVTFGHGKRSLTQDGVFLSTYFSPAIIFQALWTSLFGAKKVINGTSPDFKEDLDFLRELIEAGDLVSVIDRGYPLEEIAEAHQYVEEGHKRGNVPITVGTAVVNPARSSVREAATR
jgi:NADPH:quinone reductase-like Zn-dependent oxidoreductase